MKNLFKYEKLLIIIFALFTFWIGGISIVHFLGKRENDSSKMIPVNTIAPTIIKERDFFIKGSIPYWDQENAIISFKANKNVFNYINVFWYYLNYDGSIQKYEYAKEDTELIKFAHENNIKVSAVITNLGENPEKWDSGRVEEVINSTANRKNHITQILNKLNEKEFDGVIIDYELLKPTTRNNYTLFIKELSEEMKKNNKITTVVLHPKTGENVKGESISRYQDWQKLTQYADQVQIMGYSEHTDEDEPGPIAGIDWVGKIVNYTLSLNIPVEKVFLGIPLYGYDWDKNSKESAAGLTLEEVSKLIKKENANVEFDKFKKSPMFRYDSHEVWFEDKDSIKFKTDLAYKSGFAGVTFWRLGGDDSAVWQMIEENYN